MRAILYLTVASLCACCLSPQAAGSAPRLQVIESGLNSGIVEQEARFAVLSDQGEFAALHQDIHSVRLPAPPVPEIDFSQWRVLAGFMGVQPTGGYAIGFTEPARLYDAVVEVTVRFETPPPGAILPQVITSPFVIARLEKGAYSKVRFVDEEGKILETVEVD